MSYRLARFELEFRIQYIICAVINHGGTKAQRKTTSQILNNMRTKVYLLALLLFLGFQRAKAQTDSCIVNLKNASTSYDGGEYDAAIRLLKSSLDKCNLDKQEKIEAYKLLILSYLKVDNLEEADKAAGQIMKIDPYYKPDKFKDDPRLSGLFEKYKPAPVFRMGISGGINTSYATAVNTYYITHPDETQGVGEYNSKSGFQLGLSAEYCLYRDLWMELGFGFRQSNYQHILNDVNGATIDYSEQLSYFDLPVSLKYYFLKGALKPYLEGGANLSFLSEAISTTKRDEEQDLIDRTAMRNDFMGGWFGGAGAVYSIKGLNIFAGARYIYYSEYVNKEGTRNDDPVNTFKYNYIDDDFRLDYLEINAGVSYNLSYKNQKIK